MLDEREIRQHCCCFTGHRPEKLHMSEDETKIKLESAIQQAVADGYTIFVSGMARGVDIWAAQIILRYKAIDPFIQLIAAVPYNGFETKWSKKWQSQYNAILKSADLIKYICPGYSMASFQKRNEWMVDQSSRVLAVYNGESGGTKNTLDYAEKNKVEVRLI